jgi:hypothetical protein
MVAATGVLVAAVYYIINLRNTQRNLQLTLETRQISLLRDLTKESVNSEGMMSYIEQLGYEWKDYGDFERKYGTENNVEAAARRYSLWITYNSIGAMLRRGVIKIEDLYDAQQTSVLFMWEKYKGIIEESRRRYNG